MDVMGKIFFIFIGIMLFTSAHASNHEQNVICHTQLLVTTPQTVGFYLGRVTKNNFVGYTTAGKWINTYDKCVNNKKISAVVWDQKGERHTYHSKKKYNNINNFITLIYPQDFNNVKRSETNVFCNIHILNNSNKFSAFYVKHARASNKLTVLAPWQSKLVTSPCFTGEKIIAKVLYKDRGLSCKVNDTSPQCIKDKYYEHHPEKWKEGQRYKSIKRYTDINKIPYIAYPDNFKKAVNFNWHWVTDDG